MLMPEQGAELGLPLQLLDGGKIQDPGRGARVAGHMGL